MGETPEIKATKFMEAAEKYTKGGAIRDAKGFRLWVICPTAEVGRKAEKQKCRQKNKDKVTFFFFSCF